MERILTTVFIAAIFLGGMVRGEDDAAYIPPTSLVFDTGPTPTRDPNAKVVLIPGSNITTSPSAIPNKPGLDAPAVDNIPLIIGLVIGISFLCMLIILGIWLFLRKRRQSVAGHKLPEEEWERGSHRESIRTLGGSRVASRVGSRLGHVEISRPQMAMAVSVRSTRSLDSRLILVDRPGNGLGPLGTREVI